LTGEGGLLQQLTKTVLESALEGEITDHLGYDKHDPAGKDGGNSRNGTRSKTVLTDIGPFEIDVPRDREGSFEPAIVKKRQRRLTGVDELLDGALAVREGPHARGDLRAPGRGLRRQCVQDDHQHDHRQQGDGWHGGMAEPAAGPRYPVVFIDAINVKIRVLSTIL
jgi:transposase-like protein